MQARKLNLKKVLSVILGGGQGSRLFPLTKDRSKPAVPLAGKYRLVDIPISNCIHAGLNQMYLLTQFNTASLHRHISRSFKFDHFSGGFVEILAAQQTLNSSSWYEGNADAVRKNLAHFVNFDFETMLILSGDQLFQMDLRRLLAQHAESGADITVATIPVSRARAQALGIVGIDPNHRILRFEDKPKDPAVLDALRLEKSAFPGLGIAGQEDELCLASMGIYAFKREALLTSLLGSATDFAKHIIPAAIPRLKVFSYIYQGYWEDIGTIGAFFEASLEMTSELPRFNFFDMTAPIFTHPRFLPGSKINGGEIDHAVVSDGCIINHSHIRQSIIGLRSIIRSGCHITRTVVLGCDYYESRESIERHRAFGQPSVGIGENTRIENAIIDKNARIGRDCVITPNGKPPEVDHALYFVRDGVVVVPREGCVPDGTVI